MSEIPLAISMGDPCGAGPDIIVKIWNQRQNLNLPPLVVIGSAVLFSERAKMLGVDITVTQITSPAQYDGENLSVLELELPLKGIPGSPKKEDAIATIAAIDEGVHRVMSGQCSALVTSPINKKALYQADFSYPGHTEYLAHLASAATGMEITPVMMIAGPELKTVPVTIHIPLSALPAALTRDRIESTIRIVDRDMRKKFNNPRPVIAVAGLNPHAGEAGAMGCEEIEIIAPALHQLRNEGIEIIGPLPADTMFHENARADYDVAVCMYHDQALVPAKMLDFQNSVNVTLGLPFVRTSPDHGTAYDIAGTGAADISSFTAAIRMAAMMENPD